jgi:hypothetical protein
MRLYTLIAGFTIVLVFASWIVRLFNRTSKIQTLTSPRRKCTAHKALPYLLIVPLLMMGCGSSETPVSGGEMHLTFDGESCTFEGPTYLKAGPATLHFHNNSEIMAAVNLVRHTGDETIQDAIEQFGEEPSTGHAPPWVEDLGTWKAILAGESLTWEGELEAGIHHMVCAGIQPYGVWFGTGLEVVE